MRGFEILFRHQTVSIAANFNISVFVYNRNGQYHVEASGLDADNMMSYKWIDSRMELGETIEIEVKDIVKPSEPTIKNKAFLEKILPDKAEFEAINTERVNRFYALEKILKEEGVL